MDWSNPSEAALTGCNPYSSQDLEDHTRRHACERCRSYKLRCERQSAMIDTDAECRRCLKARVRCITYPRLKMGRPRVISNVSSFTASDRQLTNYGTPTLTNDTHSTPETSFDIMEKDFNEQHQEFLTSGWLLEDTPQIPEQDQELGMPMRDSLPARSQMDKDDDGSSPFATVQQREEYLGNLSRLSEELLKRLYAINDEDSLKCSPLIRSTATTASVPLQCSQKPPMISIGQVLRDSQQFLDLLQPFFPASPSLAESAIDELSHPTLTGKIASSIRNKSSQSTEPFAIFDSISTNNSSLPGLVEATQTLADAQNQPRLNVPTAMTLMSCFGCLTRIYGLIFTRLETALLRSPSPGVGLDSVIPSIDLDGFGLERHFELQIKVLFEVATDMLDRVERSMEKVSAGCGNGGNSLLPLLFEIVLKQDDALEGESDDRATTMTSKKQIGNISRLLQAKR